MLGFVHETHTFLCCIRLSSEQNHSWSLRESAFQRFITSMTPRSRLSLFGARATVHSLYCDSGPEHVEPASSENSRSKVPTTTNPLPGPSAFSLTQGQMVFNLALWFSPRGRRFPLWHQKWSLFTIFKCNFLRLLFQFGHSFVYLCKKTTNHLWANPLFKPQTPPL